MTEPITEEQLNEWEKLTEKATRGPFEAYFTQHGDPRVIRSGKGIAGTVAQVSTDPNDYGRADASMMAAACTAFPALIAEVRRLRAEIEKRAPLTVEQWKAENDYCPECKWTWSKHLNHEPGSPECLEAQEEDG